MNSGESDKRENTEGEKSEDGDPLLIFGNLFFASGIRYIDKGTIRLWSSILEYNVYFLPCISLLFWIIFLFF